MKRKMVLLLEEECEKRRRAVRKWKITRKNFPTSELWNYFPASLTTNSFEISVTIFLMYHMDNLQA